jgi:hypothetical protein
MQEGEGRYVMQSFDELTTTIYDTLTGGVYALMLTPLDNLIVCVSLVHLVVSAEATSYFMFSQEVLNARLEVSGLDVGHQALRFIINELNNGMDIANPVLAAARFGADLYGQPVGLNEVPH